MDGVNLILLRDSGSISNQIDFVFDEIILVPLNKTFEQ